MDTSIIIFSIIILICLISITILFIKFNTISKSIDNISNLIDGNKKLIDQHILNDLTKLPSTLNLEKLKVKDLEVENNLTTSNINSNNDTISINSNVNINSDKIKVNPKVILNTEYNYNDDIELMKDKNLEYINIDDSNDSNIDINYKLNDTIYYVVNKYKKDKKKKKIKVENKEDVKEDKEETDPSIENYENIPSYDLFYH